jgi:hypothetical protein
MQVDPTAAGVLYDREFVVCSLDLLSGLAEGLGAGIESLVTSFLWSRSAAIVMCKTLCSVHCLLKNLLLYLCALSSFKRGGKASRCSTVAELGV